MCNFITLNRYPNQSQDKVESFKKTLSQHLSVLCKIIPFLEVVLSHFNEKSNNWCKKDLR